MPAASEVVIPIRAVDNTNKAFASVKKSLHSLQQSVFSVKSAVAGLTAAFSVGQMTKFLDTATRIENRLKLVTKSSEELVKAQEEVFRIAQITGSEFESVANLYSKVAASTESLNLKSADQVRITETISKAISISGASAASAAGAITQLGQALDSGTLRGEEFNSVNEQAPRIMKALADSLGVSRGKLRELAKEGLLTSEIVTEALLIQSETIDKEYGKTSLTVSAAFTKLENSAVKFFDVLDENAGLSDLFGEALARMARGLDKVTESMKGATKIELKKQIEELTKAQQKELIELDALVMGNNSLNIMQQNQARILRLNIAERGKHIKELRAEYDELVNGKKATEESADSTSKNTEQTKEASKASAELQKRIQALRDKLQETGKSQGQINIFMQEYQKHLERANEQKKKEEEFTNRIFEIGKKNSLMIEEASSLSKAFFESEKEHLTIVEEVQATQGQINIFMQEYQKHLERVNEQNKLAIEQKKKEEEFTNKIFEIGKKNSLMLGEASSLSKAFFESEKEHLTIVEEVEVTQGQINIFMQEYNKLLQDAKEKRQKEAEEVAKIFAVGQKNSLMTGEASVMAKAFLDKEKEHLTVVEELQTTQGQINIFMMEYERHLDRVTEKREKEAAFQQKIFEIGKKNSLMTGQASAATAAFFASEKASPLDVSASEKAISGFQAAVAAGKERVRGVLGPIAAAGGAAGGRAMSVANAFMEKGWQAGVMQLVLSNKKVQEALSKVFEALFALIDPIIDLLAPVIESLVEVIMALKPLFEKLTPIIAKLIGPLVNLIKPLLALIDITIMQVERIERLIKPLEELWEPMNKLTKVFETGAQRLIDALVQLPQRIADSIKDQLPDFSESLQIGGGQGLIPDNVPVLGVFKNGGMIPKAQNGMLVGGSHSRGGTMVAAEGGEYIFSREAVQRLGAGRLNQLNNGQDNGGVVVNIYDGTGQRISAYDSALRVEIKERAARNQQFAAVA